MGKETYKVNEIGPGMWSWDIPEDKKSPKKEFIEEFGREHNLRQNFVNMLLDLLVFGHGESSSEQEDKNNGKHSKSR